MVPTSPALLPPHRHLARAVRLLVRLSAAARAAGQLPPSLGPVERAVWLHGHGQQIASAIGLTVTGAWPKPEPGRPGELIVANHLGYLDIIALATAGPCTFVAKSEVRTWPLIGRSAAAAGTHFIRRARTADVVPVGARLAETLAAGVTVVVFAEGSSTAGQAVLPFRSALLEPAIRLGAPLRALALNYTVPTGRTVAADIAWWGDQTLPGHLWNLLRLAWIHVELRAAPEARIESDRKAAARRLHAEVTALRSADRPAPLLFS